MNNSNLINLIKRVQVHYEKCTDKNLKARVTNVIAGKIAR